MENRLELSDHKQLSLQHPHYLPKVSRRITSRLLSACFVQRSVGSHIPDLQGPTAAICSSFCIWNFRLPYQPVPRSISCSLQPFLKALCTHPNPTAGSPAGLQHNPSRQPFPAFSPSDSNPERSFYAFYRFGSLANADDSPSSQKELWNNVPKDYFSGVLGVDLG